MLVNKLYLLLIVIVVILLCKNTIEGLKGYKYDEESSIESRKINVSSVYKYKGLENDIVIVIIPSWDSLNADYILQPLSLAYVGFSRAKTKLYVIGDKKIQKEINWNK